MIFLIQYDRQARNLIRLESFEAGERERAMDLRLKLEIELFEKGESNEVVLLEADSLEALKKTHGRYFKDMADLTDLTKQSAVRDP